MKRPAFQIEDPIRKVQADSGRSIGWLPSIKEQVARVVSDLEGLGSRVRRQLTDGEPAAIVGKRVFTPESQIFAFDYLQDGSSSNNSQYVVRDAVTYEIPIAFPPPGVFCARYLLVKIWQRTYDNISGVVQNLPMLSGQQMLRIPPGDPIYTTRWGAYQTPKYAFPIGVLPTGSTDKYSVAELFARRLNFFWNMQDMKSGYKLADNLVPDQLLLPQAMGIGATPYEARDGSGTLLQVGNFPSFSNGRFEFRRPWLFERDGQASFQFRAITPVIQPASGNSLATVFQETGNRVDMSVTVQVELHGTRYVTMRDALNKGAVVP